MEIMSNWINCILATIVLIGIVEIIVPDGETRKFVLLITGIILSIVVSIPIIKMFNGKFNVADVFDIDIPEESFYYIDTLRSTVDRQSDILEEVFANNVVDKFNSLYKDMEICECKISFLHDENGKITEIKEVVITPQNSVEDTELLKQRVADICEIDYLKVRIS